MTQEEIKSYARDRAQKKYCSDENKTPRYTIAQIHAYSDGFWDGANWQSKQSPWISVDERLPELKERVLVAHRAINQISICIMKRIPHDTSNPDNPKWHWSLTNNKGEVIAWMPIPRFDEKPVKEW